MVDDDVAERTDRVVEVAAVGDTEVLGHRDLHRLDVVAVPDRFEHRVGEAQVQDLLEAHLAEVVVDAEQLRLVDVLVELRGERPRRFEVVTERLLDDDSGVAREIRVVQPLDDGGEQERWNLEVEDRERRSGDRRGNALVGGAVGEVTLYIRQPRREPLEHRVVERLAGADDRLAGAFDELIDGPVVACDTDDRAVKKPAPFEAVERVEGHHLREIAGDPEDHQRVAVLRVGHGQVSSWSSGVVGELGNGVGCTIARTLAGRLRSPPTCAVLNWRSARPRPIIDRIQRSMVVSRLP